MFITLEGIDGSGKSTQAKKLAAWLAENGHDAVLTREPGGSAGAEEIRKLLVEGDPARWSAETELLLFTAARRDHVERTIRPALAASKIVVSDRFADSTRIYQGATRGDLRGKVDLLHAAMIELEPDLTLIIDVDPTTALSRGLARKSGEDRFEDMGGGFQHLLSEGFRKLAQEEARCVLIDGSGSPEDVFQRVIAEVERHL
ncbi:MAG: dTMP kinase [Pseudomonadota bacterium]